MNRSNGGFIELIFLLAIAAVIGLGLYAFMQESQHQKVFDAWTARCYQLGGEVKTSGSNLVDCFQNDKPCQVDGYQQYETTNPNPGFNNLPLCKDGATK